MMRVVNCPACGVEKGEIEPGYSFEHLDPVDKRDYLDLNEEHAPLHEHRLKAMALRGELPWAYRRREAEKVEGRRQMLEAPTVTGKVDGFTRLGMGLYHRSWQGAVHAGELGQPLPDDYIAALPIEEMVPPDLIPAVRARYPVPERWLNLDEGLRWIP